MKKKLEKKALCSWDKDLIEEHLDTLIELVEKPAFLCGKCARAAREKRNLCRPIEIPAVKT